MMDVVEEHDFWHRTSYLPVMRFPNWQCFSWRFIGCVIQGSLCAVRAENTRTEQDGPLVDLWEFGWNFKKTECARNRWMASNSVLRVLDLLSVCAIRIDELAFF